MKTAIKMNASSSLNMNYSGKFKLCLYLEIYFFLLSLLNSCCTQCMTGTFHPEVAAFE